MKETLKKLKLIDNLTINLEITKKDFVKKLSNVTDKGSIGVLSDTFDVFSSSKNELKGHVDYNGFKLKRRKRFFDNMNMAVATGKFKELNGKLIIDTEINGFNNYIIIFFCFLIIFYSIFIIGFIFSNDNPPFFILPFIFLHASIMILIPYFMIKSSVKRLKYELEREFFFLTK